MTRHHVSTYRQLGQDGEPNGQFGWNLSHDNGNVMCQGEGHPTRAKAKRAAKSVQKAFADMGQIEFVDR